MSRISYSVRKQMLERLANETLGFNPTLAAIVAEMNADDPNLDLEAFEIDFVSNPSDNFFIGEITVDDLLATGTVKFPCMTLSTSAADNNYGVEVRQKSHSFSGTVYATVQVHLTWANNNPRDFETLADAVAEALIYVFNRQVSQNWPEEIAYNGQITVDPGQVSLGSADHWQRSVSARLQFGVHVL